MNFLAHCLLSCDDAEILVGNFLADFLSQHALLAYPPNIWQGVLLHRQIDSFTDAHPVVRQSTSRLHEYHHKYAMVIVDVFYDYFLARHWHRYSALPLRDFADQTYQRLSAHAHLMPSALCQRLEGMIAGDWLLQYGQLAGQAFTFDQLRKKMSKPWYMDGVMDSLARDEQLLEEEFMTFFPDVQRMAASFCGNQ